MDLQLVYGRGGIGWAASGGFLGADSFSQAKKVLDSLVWRSRGKISDVRELF